MSDVANLLAKQNEADSLATYADQIRNLDWTAPMSDDPRCSMRFRARKKELKDKARMSKSHARLWELGEKVHSRFTWSAEPGKESGSASRQEVNENAWRWVGAYCWAHGVRLTADEAKALVGEPDGYRSWYDRLVSTAQDINWTIIDRLVKSK